MGEIVEHGLDEKSINKLIKLSYEYEHVTWIRPMVSYVYNDVPGTGTTKGATETTSSFTEEINEIVKYNVRQINLETKIFNQIKRTGKYPYHHLWVRPELYKNLIFTEHLSGNPLVITPIDDKISILTYYFQSIPIVNSSVANLLSPYDMWTRNRRFREDTIQMTIDSGRPYMSELIESIWKMKGTRFVTNFPALVAKYIYESVFTGTPLKVLDPCAGWGDRLLGAIGTNGKVGTYIGYDPNMELKIGHDNIVKFYDETTTKMTININYVPFEKVKFEGRDEDAGTFDVVFTSPPFFDFEKYTDVGEQSIKNYPTIGSWINSFFRVLVETSFELLKPGGILGLYIEKISGINMLNLFDKYIPTRIISYVGVYSGKKREIYIYKK